MNETSFMPQRIRPTTAAPGGIRTPRLTSHKSQVGHAAASQFQKILPSLPSSEQNQTAILKQLFIQFVECLNKLLAHNCATNSFRNTLSSSLAEVQRLFGVFLGQTIRSFGTMPVLQKGMKPAEATPKNLIRGSSIPFLKAWKKFARSVCEMENTGPDAIRVTVKNNFIVVDQSLEAIAKTVGSLGSASIHNTAPRSLQALMQQNGFLLNETEQCLSNPSNIEALKNVANKIKSFSRLLNDSFTREFNQSGVPGNELVRVRQKTYTALSDAISAIKGAYLFEMDMNKVFSALDEFQDCLGSTLECLDLPLGYLYRRHVVIPESNTPIASARSVQFDEEEEDEKPFFVLCESIHELLKAGEMNQSVLATDKRLFRRYMRELTRRANELDTLNEQLQADLDDRERTLRENEENYEADIEQQKARTKELEQTLEEKNNLLYDLERELSGYREHDKDNVFKECLRGVARKLGGVLQEESVNFETDDDDDDQLISKVDALTVYVVERKCQKCVLHKKQEDEMRAVLSRIVDPDDEDTTFPQLIDMVVERFDELEEEIQNLKKKNEINLDRIEYMNNGYNDIMSLLGINAQPGDDIVGLATKATEDRLEENKKQFQEMVSEKDDEITKFADRIFAMFSTLIPTANLIGSPVERASALVALVHDFVEEKNNFANECLSCLEETKERLSAYLNITESKGKKTIEFVKALLTELETRPNPLKDALKNAEDNEKFLLSSIEILSNRLRGLTESGAKKATSQMAPKQLVKHTIGMLEKFQDQSDALKKEITFYKGECQMQRKCMEDIDLKLHKYLQLEDVDMTKMTTKELIMRVNGFVEDISKPSASKLFIAVGEVDKMFNDVYDLVPVTTRSDPRKYIPEVCSAFVSLNGTILALKPFASILNDIFSTFDCKFSSFNVSCPAFKTMRQHVMELHSTLTALSPTKMNSLVFLILSRFIALLSSFLSAVGALTYNPSDEQAKQFFFSLQQENERLLTVLEREKIAC